MHESPIYRNAAEFKSFAALPYIKMTIILHMTNKSYRKIYEDFKNSLRAVFGKEDAEKRLNRW